MARHKLDTLTRTANRKRTIEKYEFKKRMNQTKFTLWFEKNSSAEIIAKILTERKHFTEEVSNYLTFLAKKTPAIMKVSIKEEFEKNKRKIKKLYKIIDLIREEYEKWGGNGDDLKLSF